MPSWSGYEEGGQFKREDVSQPFTRGLPLLRSVILVPQGTSSISVLTSVQ